MLTLPDLESTRRSAAMAPLSADELTRVFDTCARLLRERAQIEAVLAGLSPSFGAVRQALNDLQRIVTVGRSESPSPDARRA